MNSITAKEKQSMLIKTYLKPVFKQYGYLTKNQTWWRDQGDFFLIINLQNFSWNTENDVTFCFNIGIGLKNEMKDISKEPTHFDLTIPIREDSYLSDSRTPSLYRSKTGYVISTHTNIDEFIKEIKLDFETEILPKLDKLKTINNCVDYYGNFPFWGDRLKELVRT
ncbi:MAG TPA: DUF4304 domain-containing protein [Mucilaginibacter sp.]|nr:DUF4304 domain-containing protein [Mucilaginibacter sp.]